ncbi:MAG: hypothetical protein E5W72_19105 [Mesorhizobium sp.]|uniref:hypothetical protein n=1 Tax=Mesorhizobium sp. TaxID=1871066 RepID=UPI0011FB8D0C|nr:hypothetical protein [Mesorhizobium sp.]TIT03661.1 MAG: hypothetical protein E5W87_04190 [Mesorhizobium sp.]TIT47957.1 MAG: hypothetical protein E5W72_19105 [Mesorhizobium sp.]
MIDHAGPTLAAITTPCILSKRRSGRGFPQGRLNPDRRLLSCTVELRTRQDVIPVDAVPNQDARAVVRSWCKMAEKARFGSISANFAREMRADNRFLAQIALFSAFSIPSVKPVQRLRVDLC